MLQTENQTHNKLPSPRINSFMDVYKHVEYSNECIDRNREERGDIII